MGVLFSDKELNFGPLLLEGHFIRTEEVLIGEPVRQPQLLQDTGIIPCCFLMAIQGLVNTLFVVHCVVSYSSPQKCPKFLLKPAQHIFSSLSPAFPSKILLCRSFYRTSRQYVDDTRSKFILSRFVDEMLSKTLPKCDKCDFTDTFQKLNVKIRFHNQQIF